MFSLLKWAFGSFTLVGVVRVMIRPRLVAEFDFDDRQCNEPVGVLNAPTVIAVALRIRVRHLFGARAKGCVGKLIELHRYGAEPEERGGQPLPWRDRDTREGITLGRGDVEYVNVANVHVDRATGKASLVTLTPRGGKRIASLPTGAYHFEVAIDLDNGMSPRICFGIMFNADAKPNTEPFLGPIAGSVERTPMWRIWLGL